MNITYRRATLAFWQKEQIAREYNAGVAIATILATHGIGRSTLYKVLRDVMQVATVPGKRAANGPATLRSGGRNRPDR